jgi:hypothetical protein
MKGFMKSLWKIVLLAFEDWSIVSSPSKINVNFDEKYKYAKIPTNRELSIARLEYVLER